ncbi:Tudor domain-containing protein 5, partial [Armadillidium nasatum]
GFYDAYAKEFEPFSSPEDLKNLLENEKGFFNFTRQHGKIFVTAGAFYQKFWVIKRGKDNSEALDEMMDRMLEFYGGEIGKRFLIPKENTPNIPGSPVVALYPQDMNFYRAIVISREDVQNVKIFYIDYGTNDSVSLYSLYYLHRKFFDLPAQAIKCSLHGIRPVNKKTSWPKSDTPTIFEHGS